MVYIAAEGVARIPLSRWDVDELYDPEPGAAGKIYTRHGGLTEGVEKFDAWRFGIAAAEATWMNP